MSDVVLDGLGGHSSKSQLELAQTTLVKSTMQSRFRFLAPIACEELFGGRMLHLRVAGRIGIVLALHLVSEACLEEQDVHVVASDLFGRETWWDSLVGIEVAVVERVFGLVLG